MHGSTRNRLEDLLKANDDGALQSEIQPHLSDCQECSLELGEMRQQAAWMRGLRAGDELEPTPGFYARVLQRIEERAKASIWYGLVYSPVGKRVAYAALSLALALGLYVVAAEHEESRAAESALARQASAPEISGTQTPAEQRDAVLVNLASYTLPNEAAQ